MTLARPPRPLTALAAAIGRLRAAAAGMCMLGLAVGVGFTSLLAAPRAEANEADADKPVRIQAPYYGDALWHFYQGRHFSAITSLMASQQLERITPHGDEAEVLRGGMLLSYGLHREANDIFARLIEQAASPAVQDRAWFFLAKIRFQRGFTAESEQALKRIGKRLPAALEEERLLLKAQVLMARNDFAGAADLLRDVSTARIASSPYVRFNLGVALLRSGDAERGNAMLTALGQTPPLTSDPEELRGLRDRANLALGFAALQADEPAQARSHLERVRLHAMQSNKALLGFGWAAASLKEPAKALVPWVELAGRDASDPAVLEARIAVPYAYAELGALGQAQEHYQLALAAYDTERKALDDSMAAIRSGQWLEGLLQSNPGEEMGWFWQIGTLPELPHSAHLAPLLARHEFQESFKNLRDLLFLTRNLQGWADNLGVFGDMLAHRQKVYEGRLPQIKGQAEGPLQQAVATLQQRRDALTTELVAAEASGDGVAFADKRQRELRGLIDGVAALLEKAGADPEFASARERLRLAAGALTWDLARQQPERSWNARKALKASDDGLAAAREREAAIRRAQQDEPARFAAFAQRIAELDQRIRGLTPQVAALGQEQQQAVQALALAELEGQKQRLDEYTIQAQFALAQIQDRALLSSNRSPSDVTAR